MTQHLCQGLLNAPHASLTVTHCRMPGFDRCRTKGAVIYHYVPSLLPSFHPPILCLPLRETGPLLLQSGRCCVADLNVMAEVEKMCGGGSEPNKLCWKAVFSSSLFYSAPGGALPASTCSPEVLVCLWWTIMACHAGYFLN